MASQWLIGLLLGLPLRNSNLLSWLARPVHKLLVLLLGRVLVLALLSLHDAWVVVAVLLLLLS